MRIKSSIGQKLNVRRALFLTSSVILLVTFVLTLYFNLGNPRRVFAAPANGDYRSNGSGNWSTVGTWQRYNGSSWVAAAAAPNSTNGVITIQSGHTVTVTVNVTVDQVVVNSGGVVVNNSGITYTLANGAGTDLDVTGTFRNAGTVTISASANIVYQSGGKYQHNYTTTAGTIPNATWSTGSTCEIIGYTNNNTAPAGLQAFYNFTWNCPAQNQDVNLGGGLTTVNGALSILSTNNKTLELATGAITITVDDFIQSGGTCKLVKGNANSTMNVNGDLTVSGGVFTVADGNNPATINLSGNMTHSGGNINQSGSSIVSFVFKKSGTQTYTASANTVSGNIDYTVNSGSITNLGTSIVNGRNFTVSSGGGLGIGSVDGISSAGSIGNVQVSGTRSFSTTADYTYSGSAVQVTGNGLPATVRNFIINNASDVTISYDVSVSGTLTLTSGSIVTGDNKINVTNTSTGSIAGYSSTNYVVGNLRRSVSGTGSYDFPIGTSTNYELLNLNLASVTGVSNVLASFTNASPLEASYPLSGVVVNNLTIDKMLTYGYWTLLPNASIASGTYTLTATEVVTNFTVNSGCSYSLINRSGTGNAWTSQGVQSATTQTVNGNAVTAVRSGLNLFGDFSIGYGELLSFSNPTVVSGTAGQVNAVYVFPDACSNVDAWIQILSLDGGMTLNSIDNFAAGNGYQEGWQPYVNAPGNATSSILWKITFKVKDTSTDTILPWLAISGVDIDAGGGILEFVEATYPYSYGLAPGSPLTITNNNGTYRATANASLGSLANIDTAQHQAMFQINYKNVNFFYYRTGVISTSGSTQTRQTSLYFKSFFSNNLALPIRLISFSGRMEEAKTILNWVTASESNNSYFVVERSADGETYEQVNRQRGAGNSSITLYYAASDPNPLAGTSYYRLKQVDFDGHFTYSDPIIIKNFNKEKISQLDIRSIAPNPFTETFTVDFNANSKDVVTISLANTMGQIVAQEQVKVTLGYNNYQFPNLNDLSKGIYFISLSCGDQKITKKVIRN